jgi:hypothetical protein
LSPQHVIARRLTLVFLSLACGACRPQPAATADPTIQPVYNEGTGRLEQIVSDRNRDGRPETWAHMDGALLRRIEIDRSGDGVVDRWEHYRALAAGESAADSADGKTLIDRVEEADGQDGTVTRREFYEHGRLARVEEDTDLDGRIDKWERYRAGVLADVALDLHGRGFADRRLVYRDGNQVERVEADEDGDGRFEPVVSPAR